MSNIQQERFFIPIGLSEVDRIYGQPIFSSDSTRENFLNSIRYEHSLRRIMPVIQKLVDSRSIVPAFANSSLLSSVVNNAFANKIFGGDRVTDRSLGFFVPQKNKIYILVDTDSKIFWKSGYSLSLVTFHELMHWAARNNSEKFFSNFKRPLLEFYQLFFKMCADIEVSPNNIWKMIHFIYDTFESGSPNKGDLDKLEKFYMNFISDDEEAVSKILIPLNIFILKQDKFFNEINSDRVINRLVISLLKCYSQVFGVNKPETTPIQEIIFPSEVAAVTTSRPTAQHYSVF